MTGDDRRRGDRYLVTDDDRAAFERDGYVHLPGVLSEEEVAAIEEVYDRFLRREIDVPGKDLNDMTSGEHGTDPSGYAIKELLA